jgi:hypothetical protein
MLAYHSRKGGAKSDMEPIDPFAQSSEEGRERLYRIKKALAEGTYAVDADALAAKLLHSMLEPHGNGSPQITVPLQTETQAVLDHGKG